MKILSKIKANSSGFAHHVILPVAVIALIAVVGVRVMLSSHAATPTALTSTASTVGIAAGNQVTPNGFWIGSSVGSVLAQGTAIPHGSLTSSQVVSPIVGIVSGGANQGYWMVARNGAVYSAGSAAYHGGSPAGVKNIVGMAPAPDGQGYWLVGSDGGVFAYGSAQSHSSVPGVGIHVNNIVGIAQGPNDRDYWVAGRNGGVYAFPTGSDTPNNAFYGSLPSKGVSVNNIVGIASSHDHNGYYLVGSDGGVFAFGDAGSYNSLPGEGIKVNNIVGMAVTPDGKGYWLIANSGKVYPFGDAKALVKAQNTYTNSYFQNTNYTSASWDVTPLIDPSPQDFFYSTQLYLNANAGVSSSYAAYFGLQTEGSNPTGKIAIFSIWNAVGATGPGYASTFSGEGTGYSVRIKYPWKAGTTYKLSINKQGADKAGVSWTANVTNTSTGANSYVGQIDVPNSWSGLAGVTSSWTEYYGPDLTSCWDLNHSSVNFTNLTFNNGAFGPYAQTNTLQTGRDCTNSVVKNIYGGSNQVMGTSAP